MKLRWEVPEQDWVTTFAEPGPSVVDYVVLDLADLGPRPWLEEARSSVELIGRFSGAADAAVLERALALDVDFLCLSAVAADVDPKRLPLRLIVEESLGQADQAPTLFGAAWARRILDWEGEDPTTLAGLARRERIFLAPPARLPDEGVLAGIDPFALGVPAGCSVTELRAFALR